MNRGLFLLLPALFLARPALADQHGETHDPDNVTAISEYQVTVNKALERWAAKEHTNAIDTLRKAIRLAPKNPLGPLLLAELYILKNNLGEAEAALAQARDGSTQNAQLYARVLYFSADLSERQKKWDAAVAGWQLYVEYVGKAGVGWPEVGAQRFARMQKHAEMEKAYVAVRQRASTTR